MTGDEISSSKQIAKEYLKSRFIIDFLSAIPFDFVLRYMFEEETGFFSTVSMLKLFRVLRL